MKTKLLKTKKEKYQHKEQKQTNEAGNERGTGGGDKEEKCWGVWGETEKKIKSEDVQWEEERVKGGEEENMIIELH